jgi:hypothetical protein
MKQIDNITDNASQALHVTLDTGERVDLTLRFLPSIQRWVVDVASNLINISNVIITNHPNILWSFSETGLFGLACKSQDDVEPFQFDDFLSGRSELFLLEVSDLASAREFVAGYPII